MADSWKWKRYRDWSIKRKLLAMTGVLLLGSVFLESYLSYTRYTRDFERQSAERVQQIIEQVSLNVETYLDELYRMTLMPYRNAAVMAALEAPLPDTELAALEKRRLVEGYLDEMMIYPRKDILRVSILSNEVYSSARLPSSVVPNEDVTSYDWYQRALASQEYIFVPSHLQPGRQHDATVDVFSIVKQLRSISNTQRIIGVIKADANYNGIVDICRRAETGRDGGLYILDEGGRFIYASDDRYRALAAGAAGIASASAARAADSADAGSGSAGMRTVAVNGLEGGADADAVSLGGVQDGYMINTADISRVGWRLVAVNSVDEMNRAALQTRNTAFGFAIGSSLFGILVLVWLIRRFLQPLLAVVKLMKEVERGRLDVKFESGRTDEVGYLGSAFNRLVARIGEMLSVNTALVKEVYEAKLLQQEAQIHALQSQIRPHFLFNTLNLISLTVQSGQSDKAVDHLNRLSQILRSMATWDKDVPLGREIELLQAYLGIQSSRYEGRLDYRIEVDAEWRGRLVPALLLQPLVENAVLHGCESRRGKTTIVVRSQADAEAGVLKLIVEDDGDGMDAETLAKLRARLADGGDDGSEERARGTGIGLVNVNNRVRSLYGDPYGIEIDSEPGRGMRIAVVMPLAESGRRDDRQEGNTHV